MRGKIVQNLCSNNCKYYKDKNKNLGFCSLKTKLVIPNKECTEYEENKSLIVMPNIERKIEKIIIENGIKTYIYLDEK